jgi:hypothetical protein
MPPSLGRCTVVKQMLYSCRGEGQGGGAGVSVGGLLLWHLLPCRCGREHGRTECAGHVAGALMRWPCTARGLLCQHAASSSEQSWQQCATTWPAPAHSPQQHSSAHLDDGGVQGVEVQQQHVLVVQALLGLQDQAAGVLRALGLLAAACRGEGKGRAVLWLVAGCCRLCVRALCAASCARARRDAGLASHPPPACPPPPRPPPLASYRTRQGAAAPAAPLPPPAAASCPWPPPACHGPEAQQAGVSQSGRQAAGMACITAPPVHMRSQGSRAHVCMSLDWLMRCQIPARPTTAGWQRPQLCRCR